MENSGVMSSGSTFIEFDDVEVPAENLIGTENEGFKYVMSSMLALIYAFVYLFDISLWCQYFREDKER